MKCTKYTVATCHFRISSYNETKRNETRRGEARRGEARRGEARRGEARRGEARRGEARRGEARRGEARRGEARRGVAYTYYYIFCTFTVAIKPNHVYHMRILLEQLQIILYRSLELKRFY